MQKKRLLFSWMTILVVPALLLAETWFPSRLLVPLAPDDFRAWRAGRAEESLARHPHPNYCMSDLLHLLIPGLETTRQALERGELPQWDASQGLGVPHIAEVHYAVFYPPAWIPLFLGLSGLGLLAWLHLVMAGGGTLLYLRALGRSEGAALLGALAFALSAWITARMHSFPVVGAAVWLPWILYGLQSASGKGTLIAALAVTLSLLAGFPQVTSWLLVLAGLLELVRFACSSRKWPARLRRLLWSAAAVLLGLLLAAPQVLPTLDYMAGHSARGEQKIEQVGREGLEAPLLAHLIAPDYYSSAGIPGFQPLGLGRIDQALLPPAINRAEVSLGIGVFGLALALLAMIFGRTWIERFYTLIVLLLFALLLWPSALRAAAAAFPPLRFGNPKRIVLLTTFALSVLAAGGVDLLRAQGRWILRVCCGIGLALSGAALLLLLTIPPARTLADVEAWAASLVRQFGVDATVEQVLAVVPPGNFQQAAEVARGSSLVALAASLLVLIGGLILLFRSTRLKAPPRFRLLAPLLCFLLCCELGVSAFPMLRSAPTDAVTKRPGRIGALLEPELARKIRAVRPEGPVPLRLIRLGNEPSDLRPNFPGLFGLQDAQAYAPMVPRRYAELLNAISPGAFVSDSALGGFTDPARLSLPAVDMLGIDVVLTRHAAPAPSGFVEAARVGPIRVLENQEALPRAWIVPRVEQVSDPKDRLARLASPGFAPKDVAIVEQELDAIPGGEGTPSEQRRGVRIARYQSGRLELELDAGAPGLLLVSENWHPGWQAEIDGTRVETLRANHALIGIPIRGDGAVKITLQFRSRTLLAGWGLSLLGLILMLLLALFGRRIADA
ncbi:MAG: YfhO family protein [Planctomycetota bacterium]